MQTFKEFTSFTPGPITQGGTDKLKPDTQEAFYHYIFGTTTAQATIIKTMKKHDRRDDIVYCWHTGRGREMIVTSWKVVGKGLKTTITPDNLIAMFIYEEKQNYRTVLKSPGKFCRENDVYTGVKYRKKGYAKKLYQYLVNDKNMIIAASQDQSSDGRKMWHGFCANRAFPYMYVWEGSIRRLQDINGEGDLFKRIYNKGLDSDTIFASAHPIKKKYK